MGLSLEHIDAHLPVTTLKVLRFEDARVLVLGQGVYAQLIDGKTGDVLGELRTFKRNRIHGFTVLHESTQDGGTHRVRLLAWGDRSLRLIDLNFVKNNLSGNPDVSLLAASAEYLAPDWILDGCVSKTEDGSAYLVTAHNAILNLTMIDDNTSKYGMTLHLQHLAAGVKSILYSADIISISPFRILVAAGTVFGEIIVWSCFLTETFANASSSIHHFFTGHEGSIFGVQISPTLPRLHNGLPGRLLASCSDDRTVRIWDISDCEDVSPNDPSAYSTDGFELRCTGFGAASDEKELTSESCVASAFGHGARIWGIHFIPMHSENQSQLKLVSRGEDVQCLIWDLSWGPSASQGSKFTLRNSNSLRSHSGKHIWSLDTCGTESGVVIYTGGADGAVKSFNLEIEKNGEIVCLNRNNRMIAPTDPENANTKRKETIKALVFVTTDYFLASTTRGELLIGRVQFPESNERHVVRETLLFEQDLCPYSILSSLPQLGIALIGNDRGLIRLYRHGLKSISTVAQAVERPVGLFALDYHARTTDSNESISFITTYATPNTADLFLVNLQENLKPQLERITLHLPNPFTVKSASFIGGNQYLALASRYGKVAVFKIVKADALQPLLISNDFHAPDGINQISSLSTLFNEPGIPLKYFLTCSRDGSYRVNELEYSEGSEQAVVIRPIHYSPTTLNFIMEGSYIDIVSKDLMFYGFRGTEFILWNDSLQSEVARINCGGSHRSWAFHPSSEKPGDALFIWAQGGFNAFYIQSNLTGILRAGNHGREIKSTGLLPHIDGERPLVITGGEDTTVRILIPDSPLTKGPWGPLKCARVLVKHDTGPQHIIGSRSGKFMFTSGGFEDFLVWRINMVPLFGVSASMVAAGPKSHPKSELRVTSFDILEVDEKQAEPGFLMCLAYSNSTLNIFHYSPAHGDSGFTHLASGTYTSNCLTQARFLLDESSLSLITASTDGYFTLWNLTSVLEPFYGLSPTPHLKERLDTKPIAPEKIACENRYRIHKNSIKTVDLARLSNALTLVFAGGDDNSVTISLLNANLADSESCGYAGTINIPDAHTASVNSLKIIEQYASPIEGKTQIIIATSGNDHRVKVWQVDVDLVNVSLDGIQVQNVVDRYSPVADISSLEIFRDEEGAKLLACGVGMEMFRVNLH